MRCLTDEQIAVFIDGMTEDREYAEIKRHLARCDKCLAKMNEVYTLVTLDEGEDIGIQKPPLPAVDNVRYLRPRYYIPAAAAAAFVLISLVVFKVNDPVKVTPGSGVNITDAGSGKTGTEDVGKIEIKDQGKSESIFALGINKETSAIIRKDAYKITDTGVGSSSISTLNTAGKTQAGKQSIEDILALERKVLLIRSGYYYFMVKQTGDRKFYESVKDVMEMAFPETVLKDLSARSFDRYEKMIAGQSSADRGSFITGFFLSYYLYSGGDVEADDKTVKGIIETLKDEEVLGIGGSLN
jgi:hypothetical protein